MNKAIVTGGAGFIGSYVAEALVGRGYQVVIIDNLSSGRLSNIKTILKSKKAQFIQGNVTDLPLLRALFFGADYVFHEAAIASVPRSVKDPRTTHVTNATGTLNVLIAARDNAVKKVVYASSSAIYGDAQRPVQNEGLPPDPRSPYAVAKLAGEYYCSIFQQIYGLDTVSLRYFNVYGPRQAPGTDYAAVVPAFISSVLSGKPPVIYGNGEQTRDFVYVKDVAGANILAAESKATGIYNIGSGVPVSINELARLVTRLAGENGIPPVYKAPRPGDIMHSLADISRARSFGFQPGYSLEDGLNEFISQMQGT